MDLKDQSWPPLSENLKTSVFFTLIVKLLCQVARTSWAHSYLEILDSCYFC